jgi:hypothetical protein
MIAGATNSVMTGQEARRGSLKEVGGGAQSVRVAV